MTAKKQVVKFGGFWLKNVGMVREVINTAGNNSIVLESGAHTSREGPDGKRGVTERGGDVFFVPKGDRQLDAFKAVPSLVQYGGPLVGQFGHFKREGEVRSTAREYTDEIVDEFPLAMLTNPEIKRREAAEESAENETTSRK